MKRIISILSAILILVLSLTSVFSVAYAEDGGTINVDISGSTGDWETEPVVIGDDFIPSTNDSDTPQTNTAKISISKCTVSNIKNKTYTGKKLSQSPTVKYGKKTLKKDTDYTLSYTNNTKVGSATVTIKGKGKYTGSVKKTFKINPKGTSISKITKPKKKQLKVYFKKQATQTTGYQVQIATNSSFSKNRKTYYVRSTKTTSKLITKLSSKKKYYVRVRTYKTVGKTTFYSSWSASKNITTK